jgi:chemotaxis signal transduction protein
VARGDARFCLRLSDVSEVGKMIHLSHIDGPHEGFLGSTVLHGWSVPVFDVAFAIGAVPEKADEPRMFVATQTQPVVCFVGDEILGMRELGKEGGREGTHKLVRELVTMDGQALPMIDVSAVAKLAGGAASPPTQCACDQVQNT